MRDDDGLAVLPASAGVRLRVVPNQLEHTDEGAVAMGEPVLWFVTVTVTGPAQEPCTVREALERLTLERPFAVSARFAADRAEVTYWDEAEDVAVAAAQGLRMWSDHQASAGLPQWRVVGLEVVDRDTARLRRERLVEPQLRVLGEIRPYDD